MVFLVYHSLTSSHGQLRRLVQYLSHRDAVVPINKDLDHSIDSFEEEDSETSSMRFSTKASFKSPASSKYGVMQTKLKPTPSKYGLESFDDLDDAVMGFSEEDDGNVFSPSYKNRKPAGEMQEPLYPEAKGALSFDEYDQSSTANNSLRTARVDSLQMHNIEDDVSMESDSAHSSVLVYPLNVRSEDNSPSRRESLAKNLANLSINSSALPSDSEGEASTAASPSAANKSADRSFQSVSSNSSMSTAATSPSKHQKLAQGASFNSISSQSSKPTPLALKEPLNAASPKGPSYSRSEKNFASRNAVDADAFNRRDKGGELAKRIKKFAPTVYAFGHPMPAKEATIEEPTAPPARIRSVIKSVSGASAAARALRVVPKDPPTQSTGASAEVLKPATLTDTGTTTQVALAPVLRTEGALDTITEDLSQTDEIVHKLAAKHAFVSEKPKTFVSPQRLDQRHGGTKPGGGANASTLSAAKATTPAPRTAITPAKVNVTPKPVAPSPAVTPASAAPTPEPVPAPAPVRESLDSIMKKKAAAKLQQRPKQGFTTPLKVTPSAKIASSLGSQKQTPSSIGGVSGKMSQAQATPSAMAMTTNTPADTAATAAVAPSSESAASAVTVQPGTGAVTPAAQPAAASVASTPAAAAAPSAAVAQPVVPPLPLAPAATETE
jgi:hypothetical protein